MTAVWTIASRELASLFRLSAGWVTLALFMFVSGSIFALVVLNPGQVASLRAFFGAAGWLLLPVVPALSMRLLSEEARSGTLDLLQSSPVSESAIVLGKYLGALGVLAILLLPSIGFALLLARVADRPPELGPLVAGYLSLLLPAMFYLSLGTLCSSLTSNQTLAYVSTLVVLLAILLASALGPTVTPERFAPALAWIGLDVRIQDFARGLIDLRHFVFFLSVSIVPLGISIAILRLRRLG